MTARKGPVGLGYLPKGGRAAGAAHNRTVLPRTPPATEPAAAEPDTASGRTDVRGSARSAGRWTDRVAVVGSAVVASVATTGLLDWWLR